MYRGTVNMHKLTGSPPGVIKAAETTIQELTDSYTTKIDSTIDTYSVQGGKEQNIIVSLTAIIVPSIPTIGYRVSEQPVASVKIYS